jgi:hypothetical protein
VRANFAWIVTGEARVLEQARAGIGRVLEHGARGTGRKRGSPERRGVRRRSRSTGS